MSAFHVHCIITHNSQYIETTSMSSDRWMDKENVVYIYIYTHTHLWKWKWYHSVVSLWDPIDYSPPDSSVHGALQAKLLEWVAISFSRGSAWPRDRTWVSCFAGRFLPSEPPGKFLYTYTHTHTHTNTMEYYSAIKTNEILPFMTTWMKLDCFMLNK